MNKFYNLLSIVSGFFIKYLFQNVAVDDIIIIGSSTGNGFSDNGKHLFIYWHKQNKKAFFVTRSFQVYKRLKQEFGPQILYNYSFRGISKIIRAQYYFFTHNEADILFAHNKKTQIICLFHGMPIKCIYNDYRGKGPRKNKIVSALFKKFAVGFKTQEFDLIVSTGAFFNKFLKSAFQNENVKVLSYPRINYLADRIRSHSVSSTGYKTILYMPTHRDYGFGSLNPFIFYNDTEFLNDLSKQYYEVRYRFHPNMTKSLEKVEENFNKEMLDKNLDAQDALSSADILISDYSSCVFDYLICEKPIVFYHYDDYETADNNLYYKVETLNIGPVVKTEAELKNIITKIVADQIYRNGLIENIKRIKNKYVEETNGWNDYTYFEI